MRLFILVSLTVGITFCSLSINQSISAQTARPADHAIIQRRRLVLWRSAELIKDFPHKKRAVVTYPVISGLNAPVLRRVRNLIDFKNIFDYSLKEYREDAWLDEFNYVVNHNGNYLLDITFSQSGSGAYPDDQSKHLLINLKDGKVVKAADAFESEKRTQLSRLVNQKLKTELNEILQSLADPKSDPEDARIASEAQEPLEFTVENLGDFSVSSKGITFLYDAGYPHVIQAFEPNGKYFFSYAQLKSFIKPDGPLGQFIH